MTEETSKNLTAVSHLQEAENISGFVPGLSGNTSGNTYEKNTALFLAIWAFYLCIAAVAAIGNGLVIYAAYGNKNTGRLSSLDDVVKSLALADMIFGLVGIPCKIISDYFGEHNSHFE